MRRHRPGRMSQRLRLALYLGTATLWLTGALWLVLHWFYAPRTAFGPLPHPWEPQLMRVHGLVAVAVVFLLGVVTTAHIAERWAGERRRRSGIALAALAALLVLSGYALYYTTDLAHGTASYIHEVLGVGALALALGHWLRAGRVAGPGRDRLGHDGPRALPVKSRAP
jgi:hypothetical protein